ncbi:MAG: CoA-binding protein [Peptococcaceae bacterium]|nr:CoA-binding protein [Peptococcaceae bacterium]
MNDYVEGLKIATKKSVEDFLKQKSWAFVGASENKKKFGGFAYRELKTKGIKLTAVNPTLEKFVDEPVYSSLSELPYPVDAVLIAVSPSKTLQIVKEASRLGIKHVWMQQGAESEEAIEFCRENGMNCIHGECIMMFAHPAGVHRIHRFIWKVIGRLPK